MNLGEVSDTDLENKDTDAFINESTLGTIQNILTEQGGLADNNPREKIVELGIFKCFIYVQLLLIGDWFLGPNIASMGLANSLEDKVTSTATNTMQETQEITLDGIDDDEIDMYIMTEDETKYKDGLWNKVNANYLKEQKGFNSFGIFATIIFMFCLILLFNRKSRKTGKRKRRRQTRKEEETINQTKSECRSFEFSRGGHRKNASRKTDIQ